ncbi:MAG: AHH domain-containing protein [Rubrivivax sp.]|nr:AHH domain-containing protein [Rubrivivax sp.]
MGNRYETDAQGNQVVHLVAGGMWALNPAQALPIGPSGVSLGMTALARLARVGGMAMALVTARNEGQTGSRMLTQSMRFEVGQGALWGKVLDKQPGGTWVARPERYAGFSDGASGFTVLSDADIARLRAPITTPIPPPQPGSPPPLPIVNAPGNTTPGSQPAPPLPGTPGYVGAPPPSAQELIIERRDSEAPGASLEASGQARPQGYEAHHIVPSRAGDARMEALRQRLSGMGLDQNEAANGVWLPGPDAPLDAPGAQHRQLNNGGYNNAVVEAFRGVTTPERAREVLQDIRTLLQKGGDAFPGIRSRG